jgi:hypothetical protein
VIYSGEVVVLGVSWMPGGGRDRSRIGYDVVALREARAPRDRRMVQPAMRSSRSHHVWTRTLQPRPAGRPREVRTGDEGALPGLVLRSELLEFTPLTCDSVDKYLVKTAILRLIHHYPASDPPTVANVDVEHVLEGIKHHELDVGTWINVIGHVERRKEKGVFVQAIVVWDAGNVDLDAYQNAVEKRREAG